MRILLVCNAGMSTSMLLQRMEKAAIAKGIDIEIEAKPVSAAQQEVNNWDIVLLGPQVRHQLKILTGKSNGTPIEVIDMRDYGMMNGENVLNKALKVLND